MEENHNEITKLSVSAPDAVDAEKPETAGEPERPGKPELKKPAFLEEKKPEPYKKVTLSFLEAMKPTEQESAAEAEAASEESAVKAEAAPGEPAAKAEAAPGEPAVKAEAAFEEPAAKEIVPAKELAPEQEVPANTSKEEAASHISWNTDELPVIEDVLGIMGTPEAEDPSDAEPPAAEETAAKEPQPEETAAEEPQAEETAAEETAPEEVSVHTVWNTDELPVIEDVLNLEEPEAEKTEKTESGEEEAAVSGESAVQEPTSKPAFHIPFFGGKKDSEEDEEDESSAEEQETEAAEEEQEEDEKQPLKKPSGSVRYILIAGVVILAIILIYSLIQSRRVYHSYEVMSAVVSSDDASTSYKVGKYGMIRYSNNGIALTDKSGNVIWNQTYEMNNPIIAAAGNYIAAGDRGASTLYIFNQYGQCGKLTTDLPLQGIQMAENGVVAAILSDSESNFINLYDKQGNRLVGIRATLENTGYPLAVGVSPDASKLVVSYLTVSENAKTQTKLVFYDFSMLTGEHEKLTGMINSLCPKIQFLGENRVAVYREKGFDIYSVDGEVKMVFSTEFEDEIRSVFTGGQKLGFIFRNGDDNGKFRIELYDVSGQKTMTIYSDLDYTDICSDSDEVVLFNNNRAEIYKYNGKQVFGGDFENRITAIMPSWDTGMYWLVEDSQLSEIRVK